MVLILDGKTDLNQISLTGMRAITLLGLLAIAPRSMKEIREAFINYKIMEPSHSDDIIRVDINTLKSFGCEISRSCAKTDFKYVLSKHPFGIPMTDDDVKLLKRFFDKIKNNVEISKLFECDKLLDKISNYIYDDDIKEKFLGISPLKHYDAGLIKELMLSCCNSYTIKLEYRKSYAVQSEEKEIVAQRLVFQNDKLYLYGYDFEKQDSCTLLVNRIKSVISKKITDKGFKQNLIKIKFFFKDADTNLLLDNEEIKEQTGDGCLVEGSYFNEFLAIQRVLSLGPKCVVKEPIDFRNKIIAKLKNMRKLYE